MNQHIGATLVNEPGTFIWNELVTEDPKTAEFYTRLLGVTTSTMDMGIGEYTLFQVAGDMVGGTTQPPMPGMPSHWHVYFAVDDADATAAKISELRGSVLAGPSDSPVGRIAVARDPQRAMFSVIQPAPPPSA